MSIEEAVEADRSSRILEAATKYEVILDQGVFESRIIVNLAVLYWQATDFGIVTTYDLPHEFVSYAGRRWQELLSHLVEKSPASLDGRFWKSYMCWTDFGEPFDPEECRQSLRALPEYLEPAMYLYARSNGEEAANLAASLFVEARAEMTMRARYVASVIEGVNARNPRRL